MREKARRTSLYSGTAREVGLAAGRRLGKKLEKNIDYFLRNRPLQPEAVNLSRLKSEAVSIIHGLPLRFREELEGLAEGAGVPLPKAAAWIAVERYVEEQCSGFICDVGGRWWVARNNDFRAPALWGHAAIKNIKGRISTITFGMEGNVFTATGINREQLWLHTQHIPTTDKPRKERPLMPRYVLVTEALETCRTIAEVEKLLADSDRDGASLLFAAEGKTNRAALFECNCRKYEAFSPAGGRLTATNHVRHKKPGRDMENSITRLARLNEMVGKKGWPGAKTPDDLIKVLADDRVECRDKSLITVEAALACPAQKEIWYTFGGYPAASAGNWRQLEWPW